MKKSEQREKLAKRILETEDKNILNHIQAIFDTGVDRLEEDTPDYVKKGVEEGLRDVKAGRVTSHAEVMKKYKKWLKK
jgi:predicted transcriptional regulator